MLSNAQIKLIRSLEQKKYRNKYGLYVAEGEKIIAEILIANVPVEKVFVTQNWIKENERLYFQNQKLIQIISENELKKISFLHTPNNALALLPINYPTIDDLEAHKNLVLALDTIQDPGNLGTIMRIADWFGIKNIVCSENCVDVYNPKVIQATMGAFLRVNVYYIQLEEFLMEQKQQHKIPVYGAVLNGEIIYQAKLSPSGIILLGNESKGIQKSLINLIDKPIYIPKFGGAESLNVSVAAGIICSEFLRRKLE